MDVEAAVREYFPQIIHLSLGTCRDNKPWVSEVHFAYDDELNLYFRSLTSRRHSQEITTNPHVAGNVVHQHALGEMPKGVYFEGQAKLLGAGPEQSKAFEFLQKRFQLDAKVLKNTKHLDGEQLYKITVETYFFFARVGDAPGKKYELAWNGGKR